MIVLASLSIFYSSFLELERKCCDVKTKVSDLETSIKGSGVFLEGRTFGGVSREFPIFLSFSSLLSPTPSPVDTTDCTQFRRQPTDRLTAGVYDFVSTCSSCLWWPEKEGAVRLSNLLEPLPPERRRLVAFHHHRHDEQVETKS